MSIPGFILAQIRTAPRSRLHRVKLMVPATKADAFKRLVRQVSAKTGLPAYRASAFILSLLAVRLDGTELDPKAVARYGL